MEKHQTEISLSQCENITEPRRQKDGTEENEFEHPFSMDAQELSLGLPN